MPNSSRYWLDYGFEDDEFWGTWKKTWLLWFALLMCVSWGPILTPYFQMVRYAQFLSMVEILADTHILKLGKIQYGCLKIALRDRSSMLNQRCLPNLSKPKQNWEHFNPFSPQRWSFDRQRRQYVFNYHLDTLLLILDLTDEIQKELVSIAHSVTANYDQDSITHHGSRSDEGARFGFDVDNNFSSFNTHQNPYAWYIFILSDYMSSITALQLRLISPRIHPLIGKVHKGFLGPKCIFAFFYF